MTAGERAAPDRSLITETMRSFRDRVPAHANTAMERGQKRQIGSAGQCDRRSAISPFVHGSRLNARGECIIGDCFRFVPRQLLSGVGRGR